jgi:hypothetical protein
MAGVCPVLRTGQVLGVASSFHLQQKQAQRERESQSNSSTPTGNRRGSTAGRMGATQTSAGSSGPNLGEMNLGQLYNSYDPIYAHTEDRPASLGMETCYDWTTCTGSHRETKGEGVTELGQGFFSIQISNEPCVYIFSRRPFHTKDGEGVDSWGGGEDSPRGGGKVNNSYDGGDVECSDGVDLLMPFTHTITKATQNASNSTTVDGIAANSIVNSEYLYSTESGTPTHNPAAVLEQRQRRASHSSYQVSHSHPSVLLLLSLMVIVMIVLSAEYTNTFSTSCYFLFIYSSPSISCSFSHYTLIVIIIIIIVMRRLTSSPPKIAKEWCHEPKLLKLLLGPFYR